MVNMVRKPMAKSIGVFSLIFPSHIVPIQLKILTPVGMAMVIVVKPNPTWATVVIPELNMW